MVRGPVGLTLALVRENTADAGSRQSSDGLVTVGRGTGFTDAGAVETIALDPRRSQIRRAVKRAS
jgi:hypothetical protein